MKRATRVILASLFCLALTFASGAPAVALDGGSGYGGNPIHCSGNWKVGPAVPVKAKDGRTVGYSQMWWSNSCRGNWVRAWTVNGSKARLFSSVWQGKPPGPTRKFAHADDYSSYHFTLWVGAGATEKMCGSTQIWDVKTLDWAFTGSYCRT